MQYLDQPGGDVWVADVPNWNVDDPHAVYKIGVTTEGIQARAGRGLRNMLGQMYGVLCPGLIMAEHVFRGLKRDMLVRDDDRADTKKLAITWAAKRDAVLVGDRFQPTLERREAPLNSVFVVYVSPNEMLVDFPDIYGWAEHWAWVAGDPGLPGAPIDSSSRYDECLWSRKR